MSTSAPNEDEETIMLHELLERSATAGLKLQREDGSFPPGQNYTYDEPETPVRTTSHWLTTLSEMYRITDNKRFYEAANNAVDFLLRDEVRPHGYTYHCRNVDSKDNCNGLVGQAGPIRALVRASDVLGRNDARKTAEEVFSLHPFHDELGLWERREINGRKLSFDRTLNHQILFAAASTELAAVFSPAEDRMQTFLDTLESNMQLHTDGLIKHYARPPPTVAARKALDTPRHYHLIVNEVAHHYYSHSSERRKKERGYQTVNLGGLSRIKRRFDTHEVWSSDKIEHSLEFLKENQKELVAKTNTKHGSIMPGVAIARIMNAFEEKAHEEMADLIGNEIGEKLDKNSYLLTSGDISENDQASMISTIVDFPDVRITLK